MLGDNGYEEKGDKQIKRGMGDILYRLSARPLGG